jgi:hypothetical protein
MLVVLATGEEEIERIGNQSQPRQTGYEIPSQPIKAGHGGTQLSSQLHGSINRIVFQAGLGLLLKQKGWGCDSSDRVPAYQIQGPEFKPQHHKEKPTSF